MGPKWVGNAFLQKLFLAHFEPEVTRLGPWKIPKYHEKGPLWDPKMGPSFLRRQRCRVVDSR